MTTNRLIRSETARVLSYHKCLNEASVNSMKTMHLWEHKAFRQFLPDVFWLDHLFLSRTPSSDAVAHLMNPLPQCVVHLFCQIHPWTMTNFEIGTETAHYLSALVTDLHGWTHEFLDRRQNREDLLALALAGGRMDHQRLTCQEKDCTKDCACQMDSYSQIHCCQTYQSHLQQVQSRAWRSQSCQKMIRKDPDGRNERDVIRNPGLLRVICSDRTDRNLQIARLFGLHNDQSLNWKGRSAHWFSSQIRPVIPFSSAGRFQENFNTSNSERAVIFCEASYR